MNLGDKIAASKATWRRKPSDHYPTPPDMTQALLDACGLASSSAKSLRVLEPCCGEGHIAHVLEANGHTVIARDLHHTGYGAGGMDYLSTPESDSVEYEFDAVITNPPFSLAEAFIRRALRDAPIVAMLLPSGYWHAASRAKLFESRPPVAILSPLWRPAFLEAERGKSPLMNVIWTVWVDDDGHEPALTGKTVFRLLHRPETFPRLPPPSPAVLVGRTGLLGAYLLALRENLAARRDNGCYREEDN